MSASADQLEAAYHAALAAYKDASLRLQIAKSAARPKSIDRGERQDIAKRLHQRGIALDEIAKLLNVSLQDVKYWLLPYEQAVAEDEAYQRYFGNKRADAAD